MTLVLSSQFPPDQEHSTSSDLKTFQYFHSYFCKHRLRSGSLRALFQDTGAMSAQSSPSRAKDQHSGSLSLVTLFTSKFFAN